MAEILAGMNRESRDLIWPELEKLLFIDLNQSAYKLIGEISADLRQQGLAVPLTDISIAVASAAHGAALWTTDRDFRRIQTVLPSLELYEPEMPG